MTIVVYQEKKLFQCERVSYKFINFCKSIQHVYLYICISRNLKKNKKQINKQKHGVQKGFYGKSIGEYMY